MAELAQDRPVSWLRMMATLLASRWRSQMVYRGSMIAEMATQGFLILTEFLELWVLLTHAPALGGFSLAEVALVYFCANLGFAIADLTGGSLDATEALVREGRLEALLVRPTSLLVQMITQELQLRRIGRVVVGLVGYPLGLALVGIDWTAAKVLLAVLAPLGGALVYFSFLMGAGGFQMIVVGARQAANAITYGGKYAGGVPGGALFTPIRVFFTFVAPALFTAWLPMAWILGIDTPAGTPSWLGWFGVPAGLLALGAATIWWRAGLRHYTGAGG
ncbi:ABC transporter permease [Aestuariimicrobium ganziense]|uniref:ABC transporter permease n=1 Tax=Aestuariimicrobium ganziense TaxID=2773677 RepID=UPI001940791A|nr:ABC-2 family transporter protein [Aestuariimicrobium ganziense]